MVCTDSQFTSLPIQTIYILAKNTSNHTENLICFLYRLFAVFSSATGIRTICYLSRCNIQGKRKFPCKISSSYLTRR